MRRGTGSYIVALVAIAAMLMLVSLYAELRQNLAHYAKLAREDVESAREDISIRFNSTANTIDIVSSSEPSEATALIFVSDGHTYVHKLADPIPIRRDTSIDLSTISTYSKIKHAGKRVDEVCILTSNLNLFCTGENSEDLSVTLLNSVERIEKELVTLRTSIQSTIKEEVANVKNSVLNEVVQVYRSSRLLPVLASLMDQNDYLSITSHYMPVDSATITIPLRFRYLTFRMSYTVTRDGIHYTATLSSFGTLARSSGTIVPDRQGKYVDIIEFEKVLTSGPLRLRVGVEVKYFVKKGVYYGREAVALVPLIHVRYRIEPRDSSLYILSFWNENQFAALTSACDPQYTSNCRGFRGAWFESRLSVNGGVPHTRSYVVAKPKPLGSNGEHVYVLSKSIAFEYRYSESWNVDVDAGAWVYVGTQTRDTIVLYIPWPRDYSSYSSLVFLVESTG